MSRRSIERSVRFSASDVRDVLEQARDKGLAKQTVHHIKNDLAGVFKTLWEDEVMRLSGHRNASTHMRYVRLAETLETPAAALPVLRGVPTLPAHHRSAPRTDGSKRPPHKERIQDDSRSRFRDLNSRPAVYETAGLTTQTELVWAFSAELFEIGGRGTARCGT